MSMQVETANLEYRILVLAPFGKDSIHLCRVLNSEGFSAFSVRNVVELVEQVEKGVGLILTTEEILSSESAKLLEKALKNQSAWSAVPVLAFYSETNLRKELFKKTADSFDSVFDVIYLQRPVSGTTLLSTVKTALRDRARQYRIRDLLNQLQQELQNKESDIQAELSRRQRSDEAKTAAIDASLAKSQFLANMSHEIRTPLGAILGFLELMKDPSVTVHETSQYMTVLERNSRHLLRLVDDILDLSKVEAGKMEIEAVSFSLADMLLDIAALMKFKAQEKGILFDLQLSTALPEQIVSDPVRLRQILTNAVGNAIKFTTHGRVQLVCAFRKSFLEFVITDTGKGITPEQQEKLFQPFVQADSSMTRQFGGTGLGLVLARQICEQMGGHFRLLKSQLNVGTAFEASVKIQAVVGSAMIGISSLSTQEDTEINLSDEGPLNHKRILLVEDSLDNQALIGIILKKLGATIEIASNGAEGVEKALTSSFDAVLMDIQMPFMDGHEATRDLRRRKYQVPIIALTAHAMNEERERTRASGFSDFLSKPIDREKMVQVLLKWV